jgi:TatA/E family protein of Tat protein translocase
MGNRATATPFRPNAQHDLLSRRHRAHQHARTFAAHPRPHGIPFPSLVHPTRRHRPLADRAGRWWCYCSLFGGKKIPELMRGLGQGMKEFKNAKDGLNEEKKEEGK